MKNEKSIKNPWDFSAPEYDKRSSSFLNAGTDYGVGENNPIGHKDNPKQKVSCLPSGCKLLDANEKNFKSR